MAASSEGVIGNGVAAGSVSGDAHPAPARERASLPALWFGLFGGPVAWSIQTLVNLPLASHACFPRLEPLDTPVVGGLRGIVLVVSLLALLVSAFAAVVAWRVWSRTRLEHQGGTGEGRGHDPHLAALETGEGRTRFMALAGVMTSAAFFLVSAAHAATLFLVSPCSLS